MFRYTTMLQVWLLPCYNAVYEETTSSSKLQFCINKLNHITKTTFLKDFVNQEKAATGHGAQNGLLDRNTWL